MGFAHLCGQHTGGHRLASNHRSRFRLGPAVLVGLLVVWVLCSDGRQGRAAMAGATPPCVGGGVSRTGLL